MLRFYAELRDFVDHPSGTVHRRFDVPGSVKDLIESCGVPHPEVDLVLVNGESVDFSHRIEDGDRISVFPMFESFDIGSVTRVRAEPLRIVRFVLDVHLGRLARYLRLLGFDADYRADRRDPELVQTSVEERRILLTRDVELLKHGALTHGFYVRSPDPAEQLVEVVRRCHLSGLIEPFTRCMACNGKLRPVEKGRVADRLPAATRRHHDRFWDCQSCDSVYWKGAHQEGLNRIIAHARQA